MEWIDFLIHAEVYVREIFAHYGAWVYLLLFSIIFAETGFVIMPFLPGDSLLFALGIMSAEGLLNIQILFWTLLIAAVGGDTINYWFGYWIGPKAFGAEQARWLRKEYLARAQEFYLQHGGKAIILARFVPIVRTFAPFVAGIGTMNYRRFIFFNISGGILWIGTFLGAGYYLGNLPGVKSNLTAIIGLIVFVSILPVIAEWWKMRRQKR